MTREQESYSKDQVDLQLMAKDISEINNKVDAISKRLENDYVTQDKWKIYEVKHDQLQKQADRTERIVFGIIGTIALAVLVAVVKLVIK